MEPLTAFLDANVLYRAALRNLFGRGDNHSYRDYYLSPMVWYNQLMTNTVQLTLELPRDLFAALRQEPEEFLREMRLAAAVKWYETRQVSQAKAAEIAGLSRAEFLAALGRFGVTPFQLSVDELIQEAGVAETTHA